MVLLLAVLNLQNMKIKEEEMSICMSDERVHRGPKSSKSSILAQKLSTFTSV